MPNCVQADWGGRNMGASCPASPLRRSDGFSRCSISAPLAKDGRRPQNATRGSTVPGADCFQAGTVQSPLQVSRSLVVRLEVLDGYRQRAKYHSGGARTTIRSREDSNDAGKNSTNSRAAPGTGTIACAGPMLRPSTIALGCRASPWRHGSSPRQYDGFASI